MPRAQIEADSTDVEADRETIEEIPSAERRSIDSNSLRADAGRESQTCLARRRGSSSPELETQMGCFT